MTNIFSDEQKDNNQDDEYYNNRPSPENAIDYNLALIKSEWGTKTITKELWEALQLNKGFVDPSTNEVVITESKNLWATLGFFTQDLRLANLDNAQFRFCVDRLTLAGDFLSLDPSMIEPFKTCLGSVVPVLECSQSKNGFLRNRLNTLTNEQIFKSSEPKRNVLTGKELKTQGVN